MNKIFKLIYVNILSLFNINKIMVARAKGTKSDLENKSILTGLMAIVLGFIFYYLFTNINIENKYVILSIGFIISSIYSFVTSLPMVNSIIFNNSDNDSLFALPLTKNQIVFSKLFTIYLRSMIYVGIISLAAILSFIHFDSLNQTQVLMHILITLTIPFIPLIVATVVVYFNNYFKVKSDNSWVYKIFKYSLLAILLVLLVLYFRGIKGGNLVEIIDLLIKKMYVIYPMSYLFDLTIKKANILYFIIMIGVPILFIYIYNMLMANNILKICSILKGVKSKKRFVYKKVNSLGKVLGITRKEILTIFSNKTYFVNSFSNGIIFSILLIVLVNVVDINKFSDYFLFDRVFKVSFPLLVAAIVGINCTTKSAMSLERQNMQIIRSMPLRMDQILVGKWIANIIIALFILLVDVLVVVIGWHVKGWLLAFYIIVSITTLLFISFTGLFLDYVFINKSDITDNEIIQERVINIVPVVLCLVIVFSSLHTIKYANYKHVLGGYVLAMIIFMVMEAVYLVINNKKLLKKIFS